MEYNKKSAKLEATLTLASHDLEAFLKKENLIVNSLDKALVDETEFSSIEKVINSNFFFYTEATGDQPNWVSSFKIDGHQILLNGNIEVYLSCDLIEPWTKIIVQFSLLMDYFPEQQNKITFIQKRKKTTLNFTPTNQNQPIELF